MDPLPEAPRIVEIQTAYAGLAMRVYAPASTPVLPLVVMNGNDVNHARGRRGRRRIEDVEWIVHRFNLIVLARRAARLS